MKACTECKGRMKELKAKTPEGIEYKYFKCAKCGEEIVNMEQLHNMAGEYRRMRSYHAKLSRWGLSLGLRIPKELAKRYHFKDEEEVALIPEKDGIKVILA